LLVSANSSRLRPTLQQTWGFGGMKNRIKEARALSGMTQKFLADETGLHRVYLGKIEKNNLKPNVFHAMMIARVLGCKVEDIFILT